MQERLHFMPSVTHYSITLPAFVADKLQEEAESTKTKRSTLIAQHLEQYYNAVPTAQYEAKIQELEKRVQEYEIVIQEVKQRAEAEAIKKAACEVQELTTALEQQTTQNATQMQELKTEMQQLQADNALQIQQMQAEAVQNAVSQDLVIKGLQNELENAKKDVKNLNEKVVDNAGTINELKADKEYLKKQLELLTLRLPTTETEKELEQKVQ
jgi:acyl transferase domain-containing protein